MNIEESQERKSFRGEWGLAVEIEDYLWRVRLQNPFGKLMVNTYVVRKDDVFAVFDPGWPWTLDALEAAFENASLGDISAVTHWIYTHSHIDHMGAASLLGEKSSAKHYISKKLEGALNEWHKFTDRANDWLPWAEDAIAEAHIVELFRKERALRIQNKTLMLQKYGKGSIKNFELIDVGQILDLAGLRFEILDLRGHDSTHIGFYEREKGWFISGDAVLSTPTPISRAMDDDIVLYEKSLQDILDLEVSVLLPGHGVHKKRNFRRNVERSLRHLKTYETVILQALDNSTKPMTLMEICLLEDENLLDREPTYASVQIALIDSHLRNLLRQKKIIMDDGPTFLRIDEDE